MSLKVATWNINGIKARRDRLSAWLDAHAPDVLCLQEIKSVDEAFPTEAFQEQGYHVATHGQKSYNGVAIFSKHPFDDVRRGFGDDVEDPQARFIGATVAAPSGPVRVMSAYCPNGGTLESEKYPYKLKWYQRLLAFIEQHKTSWPEAILMGDFNIAPTDMDVYDPVAWQGQVSCTEQERELWRAVGEAGFREIFREQHPDEVLYSWWDYRQLAFPKNRGLRIDHIFTTPGLADRVTSCVIDRAERKGTKPSDHAPVVAEFD